MPQPSMDQFLRRSSQKYGVWKSFAIVIDWLINATMNVFYTDLGKQKCVIWCCAGDGVYSLFSIIWLLQASREVFIHTFLVPNFQES